MTKIEQLVEAVRGHQVFIQTHNFPDPDAIATAFGLQGLLEHFGVETRIIYEGEINKISCIKMIDYFHIKLENAADVPDMNEDDYIILVDCQKYNKNCVDLPGKEIACIDHHTIYKACDEYIYSDIRRVGACASIVCEYYYEADIAPSIEISTALIYGIKMDTNDFGRGVKKLDVKMYYKLFQFADHHILEKLQLNTIEFNDLKAYGAAISNISTYRKIGFACLPFDCPDGLIAIISDFILALDVVDFAVVYSIRSSGYKFSIRSEVEAYDAGEITNHLLTALGGSGGGHSFMAGGFINKNVVKTLGDNPRLAIENMYINAIYPGETREEI